MKQTIKLNESQLRQFIHESIMNILNESFKSKKLTNAVKQHGGLKNGNWSSEFTDLYNMTDDEFDDYKENPNYYNQTSNDPSDGNAARKPIEFKDGTIMTKRTPANYWDPAPNQEIKSKRFHSKKFDGKDNYFYQNPYLRKLINGDETDNGSAGVRGKGNYFSSLPPKSKSTQLDPMAIKARHILFTHPDVYAKDNFVRKQQDLFNGTYTEENPENNIVNKARKSSQKINEAKLNRIINNSINKMLNRKK